MANKKTDLQQLPNEESDIDRIKKMLEEKSAVLELLQREAAIEVALEKVRARTMAMQQSNELAETASVLFQQLKELGFDSWATSFCIWTPNDDLLEVWGSAGDGGLQPAMILPFKEDPTHLNIYEAYKRNETVYEEEVGGEALAKHYEWLLSVPSAKKTFGILKDSGFTPPTRQYYYVAFFKQGYLLIITKEPKSDANDLTKRFAKVFEQTYTRFLDLQKAEAQAREAQIEAALEKIRSRSLAMHHSHELREVIAVLFERLNELEVLLGTVGIALFDQKSRDIFYWVGNSIQEPQLVFVPYNEAMMQEENFVRDSWIAMIEKTEMVNKFYTRAQKDSYFEYLFSNNDFTQIPESAREILRKMESHIVCFFPNNHSALFVDSWDERQYTSDDLNILRRAGKVFEQTYIRFLDLQKAEEQARESEIQLVLERVSARTMAMQRSEELSDVATVLFTQVKSLGVPQWTCGFCIWDIGDTECTWYSGSPDGEILAPGRFPLTEHPVFRIMDESRKRGDDLFIYEKEGEVQADHYRYMMTLPGIRERLQNMLDAGLSIPTFQIDHYANFSHGNLVFITYEHFPEMHDIFKRFAKVFEQTYTRFLDLQKAEAQAREATIEAALERVRAKTMAMHSSDDVGAATATMFIELEKLGIENFRGGITNILSNGTQEVWSINNLAEGKSVKAVGIFKMDEHPFWQYMYKEWEAKNDFLHYHLAGQEKEDYIKILNATQGYLPQAIQEFPDVHFQVYFFNEGAVWTNSLKPHSEEDKQVMKRFASVFSLTFRRYQDLKKAEAQAREATIEAALEKVRGKAMAMHNSNDLIATASIVFTELRKLGINSFRSGVGLLTKENRKVKLYSATSSDEGDNLSLVGWALLEDHEVLSKFYDCWIRSEDYFPEMKGELLKTYYEKINATFTVPLAQAEGHEQYGYVLPFSEGLFYGWAEKPYTSAEIKILKRFATVIDLTFRRYIELQKSEANAREAVRSASLDRVRAETASMRTTKDLEIITPLIWNELTTLGVPFIRCGVFIMDEQQQVTHIHLSTPDGKAIAAFHLPYSTPGNIGEVLNHWQQKKIHTACWSEADFTEIANSLVQQGFIDEPEQYLKTLPQAGFNLHFLPFLQGMLYVGNTTLLSEDDIHLIQSVADAFSTAYARYEDFNKLELAKEQIEKTLVDLKQAQAQLVQSEKMASLGELTAGIAHEIQNPLNFVNNFSEVNTELIDELEQEVDKGNLNEIKAIAKDIRENEQKINHHGKRADAIVKGMLQHSRTSTAIKEPTDINKLADEYLRLAYHGLRAKDKSFNATLKTDFDETIGKINIIPQDIGRVLLNLYNNAFYVVSQKHTSTGLPAGQTGSGLKESKEYEPIVSVSTKKIGVNLEIKVADNGNGISQKIVDKIFQPFFTTKPTGQGTGLGLSLAYDIVKTHGGEIEVQTKEGEGSEFIIVLPVV